ncbi:MAG: hypothetical protein Q9213_003774 [Squamulea squamosa]
MTPPIGIRYYNLRNSGIAMIIYPQFRKESKADDVLWDGRDHRGYNIGINQDITIDLKDTDINSTNKEKFYLSENTHWGQDMWDSNQDFFYDPNSTIIACATRWGGVRDGNLSYQGCKSKGLTRRMVDSRSEFPLAEHFEAYAASVAHETIRELFEAAFPAYANTAHPWKGLLKWGSQLRPDYVLAAVTLVTAALIAKGYALTFHTTSAPDGTKTTTIDFGPRQLIGPPGAVPPKVQEDWTSSVAAARKFNPTDLGVFPNTGKLSNLDDPNSEAIGPESPAV